MSIQRSAWYSLLITSIIHLSYCDRAGADQPVAQLCFTELNVPYRFSFWWEEASGHPLVLPPWQSKANTFSKTWVIYNCASFPKWPKMSNHNRLTHKSSTLCINQFLCLFCTGALFRVLPVYEGNCNVVSYQHLSVTFNKQLKVALFNV